jgi:hypothetical protein
MVDTDKQNIATSVWYGMRKLLAIAAICSILHDGKDIPLTSYRSPLLSAKQNEVVSFRTGILIIFRASYSKSWREFVKIIKEKVSLQNKYGQILERIVDAAQILWMIICERRWFVWVKSISIWNTYRSNRLRIGPAPSPYLCIFLRLLWFDLRKELELGDSSSQHIFSINKCS